MRRQNLFVVIASVSLIFALAGCSTTQEYAAGDTDAAAAFSYERKTLSGNLDLSSRFKAADLAESQNSGQGSTIWNRIRSLYALPDYDRPEVQAELEWYASHPEHLERVQERAQRYLHFIVQEAEQRGVPGEITLLPVVESAFQPKANSPMLAAGLWQFIPSTGREYGLQQTRWGDDRRDVRASTHAAMSYLIQMQQDFDGDWLLALASYNAGPGAVRRAVEANQAKGKPIDFWSLNLPRETRNYVPRLLAVAQIIKDPARYGITLHAIPNEAYFAEVKMDRHIDLQRAASLADTTMDELRSLNPEHKQNITDPEGPHALLVPRNKAALFQERLADLPKQDWLSWSRYRVRRGEALAAIAERFDTDPAMLREVNQLPNDRLAAGRVILVPKTGDPIIDAAPTQLAEEEETPAARSVYTVRRGETLYSIARKHNMAAQELAQLNRLGLKTRVRLGQKLRVQATQQATRVATATLHKLPATKEPVRSVRSPTARAITATKPKPQRIKRYTVKAGDSLSEISQRFDVSMGDLKRWNSPLRRTNQVQKGQLLVVQRD